MKKLLGLILSLSLLTGILAGCAGTPANSRATLTAADKTDAGKKIWPRTMKDALGKQITLMKKPERIAILDFGFMESLFALETPPIASTLAEQSLKGFGTLQLYAANAKIEDLGKGKAPNLEKLAELAPDLIFHTAEAEHLDMKLYERASQIAPVAMFDSPDWKKQLRDFAKYLGEEEKAEAYIADIETLIAESRSKLSGYSDKTVALLFEHSGNKGNFIVIGSAENPVWFNRENGLGLRPPNGYPPKGQAVSLEGIAALNPDYIFLFGSLGLEANGYKQRYLSEATQASSVWQSLTAVKHGHVYHLDAAVRAAGPLSIKLGIETIVKSMTK
ncbi:ABC transporter substrate-binding protein [Acetonema longum]|uniref:ABC transporter iron chelate uptake transporter periplasmic-binding protein n=1 Tax=Acetonema longum DSM 6540 TaxID=1009370 RepID=F7NN49_9FIRM|nr:ABC transporter substrate-binding protein [Acetonema longum]EGO62515.1 ABC transporter iron chelate uptake transporter periplasmic-binding protein [Acetonema longum DSM 6540]